MNIYKKIADDLKREAFERSPIASKIFICIGIISFFFGTILKSDYAISLISASITFINISRLHLSNTVFKAKIISDIKLKLLKKIIKVNSILFSLLYLQVILNYELKSIEGISAVILLTGVSAGAATSLSSLKKEQLFFYISVILVPGLLMLLYFLSNEKKEYLYCGILFSLGFVYFMNQSKIIYTLLIEGYKKHHELEREKLHLNTTLESLKITQNELLNERTKSINSERLATIGKFASGLAHEINNPLTISNGQVLKIRKVISDLQNQDQKIKIEEYLEKITSLNFKISSIIKDLRSFAGESNENEEMSKVSLTDLIDKTLSTIREKIFNSNIHLNINDESNSSLIFVQKNRVSQAIYNVINNAYESFDDKGINKTINIHIKQLRHEIHLYIEDNGIGILPENAIKIFDPFYTTKEVGKSTGLGLSVARGILLANNSKIVLLKNTKMTTFLIIFKRVI